MFISIAVLFVNSSFTKNTLIIWWVKTELCNIVYAKSNTIFKLENDIAFLTHSAGSRWQQTLYLPIQQSKSCKSFNPINHGSEYVRERYCFSHPFGRLWVTTNFIVTNTYNRIYETYSKANGGGRISIGR